jgi:hypothetical protein
MNFTIARPSLLLSSEIFFSASLACFNIPSESSWASAIWAPWTIWTVVWIFEIETRRAVLNLRCARSLVAIALASCCSRSRFVRVGCAEDRLVFWYFFISKNTRSASIPWPRDGEASTFQRTNFTRSRSSMYRAPRFERGGCGRNSCREHHFSPCSPTRRGTPLRPEPVRVQILPWGLSVLLS